MRVHVVVYCLCISFGAGYKLSTRGTCTYVLTYCKLMYMATRLSMCMFISRPYLCAHWVTSTLQTTLIMHNLCLLVCSTMLRKFYLSVTVCNQTCFSVQLIASFSVWCHFVRLFEHAHRHVSCMYRNLPFLLLKLLLLFKSDNIILLKCFLQQEISQ